ncbi:hypothetical protein Sme01_44360 [Sphaerisporangium melleum]|uniref:Histidine kinase/HSP90-like ATPase domain-containing protein n=1 Tax=Sphaerisporangium melleum TaxID=321316 RepID=A0A917VI42_9ACTN|nr:ATP-binding protein [Sphaerisporangium melleum]GGK81141.1 hypothetical protein GCM10007964_24750 [Sphaerisporangium melleum]GII71960.1 hypothetical protein Sme01_44360 [Sphaerisporangium melleum]
MPPRDFFPQWLVNAATPEELAVAIGAACPHAGSPGRGRSGDAATARRFWWLDDEEMPIRAARRLTAEALSSWGVSDVVDTALLVVSELVTNAFRHAAPPVGFALALVADEPSGTCHVVIEVTDGDPRLPTTRSPDESGGFGLTLVGSLAKVGFVVREPGKTVRATLIASGRSGGA